MSDYDILKLLQENLEKCYDCEEAWTEKRKPFGTLAQNYRDHYSRIPKKLCLSCFRKREQQKEKDLLEENRSVLILKKLESEKEG